MPDERLSRLEELMAEMLIKYDRMEVIMLNTLNTQQQMLAEMRGMREDAARYEERTEQRFQRVREELRVLNDSVTDIQATVARIHHNNLNSNEELRQRVVRIEHRLDDLERRAS